MTEEERNEFVLECLEDAVDMGDLQMLTKVFQQLRHRIDACRDPLTLAKIESARRVMSEMEAFEIRYGAGSCLILDSEGMKFMLAHNHLGFYSEEELGNSANAREMRALTYLQAV